MKHVLFILAASLFLTTANAQTDKATIKQEVRKDVRNERTDRRERRQDLKAAKRQTRNANIADRVSTAADNRGRDNIAKEPAIFRTGQKPMQPPAEPMQDRKQKKYKKTIRNCGKMCKKQGNMV